MPELVSSERWTGPNAGIPDAAESAPRRRTRRPQHGDGWRLKATDEALLTDLSRYGVMTYRQASRQFYGSVERTTVRRIGYLRDAGLLTVSRDEEWAGRVLVATSTGHNMIRADLPVPVRADTRWPGERLLHRLAVTDAGHLFERRGDTLLTERELRTAEGSRDAREALAAALETTVGKPLATARDGRAVDRRFCVPTGAEGAVHYPDLIVASPHGLVAIEVEVTTKERSRLRKILRGYRDARLFHQVIYLATPQVGALLHGHRTSDHEWAPGVLQQVSLLPDGPPTYGPENYVRVQPFLPKDPGVAFRLDMRQVPASWRIDRVEWIELRAKWEADEDLGKAAKVPFLRWWRDVEVPRRKAILRTA